MKRTLLLLFAVFVLSALPAQATQYLVTNTNSSGAGSLRDALNSAGVSSDLDTINFNIPGPGPHVINDAGLLVLYPTFIDGYSQPGAVPCSNNASAPWNGTLMIEINGDGFPGQNLLNVGFPSSEIRGLALTGAEGGYALWLSSNGGHTVAGCFIGLDTSGVTGPDQRNELGGILAESDNNTIGGQGVADRNVITGNPFANVEIIGNGNIVRGNIIGLAPDGVTETIKPSTGVGVEVTGNDNIIGGAVGGGRNIISHNGSFAITVDGDDNIIRRNRIGTDVTGTLERGQTWGIAVTGGDANIIGGRVNGSPNLICDSGFYAIYIGSGASNTIIRDNEIGVGVGGVALPNGRQGAAHALIIDGSGTQIGGPNANDGNHIANNRWGGIDVGSSAVGVTIRRNRIYNNNGNTSEFEDGLDIDLNDDGVTPNDPLDADFGANNLQNYPILLDVDIFSGDLYVAFQLNSEAVTTYAIEFFSSSECHEDGHGGGENYLGTTSVTTNGTGTTIFGLTFPVAVLPGEFITATATAPDGSTSEFSACLEVVDPFVVTTTSNAGYGSLRRAIENANANPGTDHITFDAPVFIEPTSSLPALTESVIIGHVTGGVPATGRISGAMLSPGTEALVLSAPDCRISHVEFHNFSSANVIRITGFDGQVNDCEFIDNNNCIAINVVGNSAFVNDNEILSGHAYGVLVDGDDALITDNEIYQCTETGVWLRHPAANNAVSDNTIGGPGGNGNGGWGVFVGSANPNIIGYNGSFGFGNDISYNALGGVGVNTGVGHLVRRNSFSNNGGLGIDLALDGVTPNDFGDGDSGVNNLLNFPDLSGAFLGACGTTVCGTYSSSPSNAVTIEFYSSPACDPSNYGEGLTYLGSTNVTTSVFGSVAFSVCVPPTTVGEFITAVAHSTTDGSSEFSLCMPVTDPFTVTTTAALGPGSLFDAVVAANTCAGFDTIRFDIPGTGPHFIQPIGLIVNQPVYIDGYSQPGASPNTSAPDEPNNAQIMIQLDLFEGQGESPTMTINSTSTTLKGLSITGGDSGDPLLLLGGLGNHTVEGCFIGVAPSGFGSASADTGIEIQSGNNLIGGSTPAAQNVIGNADDHNVLVASAGTDIEGNLIGVRPDGVSSAGTSARGIVVSGGLNNRIGGSTPAQRNVVSGHTAEGIDISFASETDVIGNYIGTDISGESALPNGSSGILVAGTGENRIGGATIAEANVIAFNNLDGVRVDSTATPCTQILVNLIHSNGGIGIDLNGDGVTANNTGDVWTDHPVLTSASGTGQSSTIAGDVFGTTPGTYTLHFFDNYACDGSGSGEAELYIGTTDVVLTPPSTSFNVTLGQKPLGGYITATATFNGKTSEFSPCVVPVPSSVPDDVPLPTAFALRSVAPNPFNPTTTIAYDVPVGGADVELVVFNVNGSRVRTLVNGPQKAGTRRAVWDARDDRGQSVSSGVYFARIRSGGYIATRKMVLLK